MASCEFNSLLGRYHDGELAENLRAGLEQHLAGCPACAAEVEQMQAISQTLRAGIAMPASAEFLERLQSLESQVQDVTVVRFVRRMTAAAAAILVGATVVWSVHQQPVQQAAPAVSYATADERMVIDPDSAVAMVTADPTPAGVEPQLAQIGQDLSGGRP